uniref:Band 7 domain-containing protein n=1 Tax=Romanomermis culicivorax TaxID=13658 RepID=A0A915J4G8_ROMCU
MSLSPTKESKPWIGGQAPSSEQGQLMMDGGQIGTDFEFLGHWFGFVLTMLSWFLIIITFPFSMCFTLKVVKEYERVVIFRLGRLLPGGTRGPGLIFIIPCVDNYRKMDLRIFIESQKGFKELQITRRRLVTKVGKSRLDLLMSEVLCLIGSRAKMRLDKTLSSINLT